MKQLAFFKNPVEAISRARATFGDKPFRFSTHCGDLVVLPHKYAEIIRHEKRLSFAAWVNDVGVAQVAPIQIGVITD